jgi:hypothetical protein
MRTLPIIAFVLAVAGVAAADPTMPADPSQLLVAEQVPSGPLVAAPGMGGEIQGGWGGAHAEAIGGLTAEALLYKRLTIQAGVQYDVGSTRPSALASFVIVDANDHPIGLLAAVAYKPEGLTEPDGEIESTLAVSRRIGAGLATASVTFGEDLDASHHDGEAAVSAIEPVTTTAAVGGVARARDGLGSSTDLGARWDGLAGAVARGRFGTYTLTGVAGGEAIGVVMGGTKLGVLGMLALGAWF